MSNMDPVFVRLEETDLPEAARLYKISFAGDPWNDDWSDEEQLMNYIREVSSGYGSLNFGLRLEGRLIAVSLGHIRHWWEGTNYNIEELCVDPALRGKGIGTQFMQLIEKEVSALGLAGIFLQTDSDKPSYQFYHKNGFNDLHEHVSMYKSLRNK